MPQLPKDEGKRRERALEELDRRYGRELRTVARMNCPRWEDGEDVYQEALERLVRQGPWESLSQARAWMQVVVRRLAWRSGRHSQFDRRVKDSSVETMPTGEVIDFRELTASEGPGPLEQALSDEETSSASLALRLCKEQERLVLALSAAGYGHAEIEGHTGLSTRQIRKRVELGRRRARTYRAAIEKGGACAIALRTIAAGGEAAAGHLRDCRRCLQAAKDFA